MQEIHVDDRLAKMPEVLKPHQNCWDGYDIQTRRYTQGYLVREVAIPKGLSSVSWTSE